MEEVLALKSASYARFCVTFGVGVGVGDIGNETGRDTEVVTG